MAKNKNIDEVISKVETETVPKAQFDKLAEKTVQLENMLASIMEKLNNSNNIADIPTVNVADRMNSLCTLIHLVDCDPQLPDSVKIGGKIHYFSSFGEKKAFRWEDLSNFISTNRILFARGVFALGEDCEAFRAEIPSDIRILKLPSHFYNNMVSVSNEEFESIVSSLGEAQRIQISISWRRKYLQGAPGYKNTAKLKIINKLTNNSLKDILEQLAID